ncbi:uncharacterized protein F5891DRAFT_1089770 [Suillus fuscotomentosus]|uniref:Uncharacterized protein n=1 Tax=Suillus fuscotomentosus TaxID=1912939 RepID=A0AAD4DPG4_9AGAM|nr:uncharacterized protein F5891DRAFT_1089770 [Suillus fuscotomentosus]KAG1884507.1 hypothetical protein F5891DRAFT_1089770 [Suillus fuscotomentosus]
MSLKQGRSFTSRWLATLFRPFMSEPPPDLICLRFQLPQSIITPTMSVREWSSWMAKSVEDLENRYQSCPLNRIEYCKCAEGAEHEFLVFYFRHWSSSSAEAVVCADRTVHPRQNCSSAQSELLSPSSFETNALDHVYLLGPPRNAASFLNDRFPRYNTLCTLRFLDPAPSALQISVVLSLVHRQAPSYHLYGEQCYWFSHTSWMSLAKIFPNNQELCNNHNARCRYRGIAVGLSDQGFKAVVAAYELEWQNTLDILQGEILRRAAPIRRLEEETERLRAQEVENAHIREAMEVENAQLREAMMQREHQAQAEIEELRAKLHTALACRTADI